MYTERKFFLPLSENLRIKPLVRISLLEDRSIYPGPNLEVSPIDHGKVKDILLLNYRYQHVPGYIVAQCIEDGGSRLGFIPIPDSRRYRIIRSISLAEKIILDKNGTPGQRKLANDSLPIALYIGDILNPELLPFPVK